MPARAIPWLCRRAASSRKSSAGGAYMPLFRHVCDSQAFIRTSLDIKYNRLSITLSALEYPAACTFSAASHPQIARTSRSTKTSLPAEKQLALKTRSHCFKPTVKCHA